MWIRIRFNCFQFSFHSNDEQIFDSTLQQNQNLQITITYNSRDNSKIPSDFLLEVININIYCEWHDVQKTINSNTHTQKTFDFVARDFFSKILYVLCYFDIYGAIPFDNFLHFCCTLFDDRTASAFCFRAQNLVIDDSVPHKFPFYRFYLKLACDRGYKNKNVTIFSLALPGRANDRFLC